MSRSYSRLITTPAAARAIRDASRPFVSLLTDFGLRDPSAAICKGVVLGIAPEALVVDISHEVDKYAVRDGALLLWCALPYLPLGAHVAVVDPGVGTDRRPLAVETGRGDMLVGPDNGILMPAARRVGGIRRVHLLENPQYRLPVVSSSFHGRDLFSPAAAHLAVGVPIETLGRAVDPRDLVPLDWPEPTIDAGDGTLTTEVIYVDTFGNLKLSALPADLQEAIEGLELGDRLEVVSATGGAAHRLTWSHTFGAVDPGDALLYEDSYGRLCLAANQGALAEQWRIGQGTKLTVRRAT